MGNLRKLGIPVMAAAIAAMATSIASAQQTYTTYRATGTFSDGSTFNIEWVVNQGVVQTLSGNTTAGAGEGYPAPPMPAAHYDAAVSSACWRVTGSPPCDGYGDNFQIGYVWAQGAVPPSYGSQVLVEGTWNPSTKTGSLSAGSIENFLHQPCCGSNSRTVVSSTITQVSP